MCSMGCDVSVSVLIVKNLWLLKMKDEKEDIILHTIMVQIAAKHE